MNQEVQRHSSCCHHSAWSCVTIAKGWNMVLSIPRLQIRHKPCHFLSQTALLALSPSVSMAPETQRTSPWAGDLPSEPKAPKTPNPQQLNSTGQCDVGFTTINVIQQCSHCLAGGLDFDRLLHPVGISTLQDVTFSCPASTSLSSVE